MFHGYTGNKSTKDNIHQRRKTHTSNKVDITDTTQFSGKKEEFLSNDMNKQTFITMIAGRLENKGFMLCMLKGCRC